MQCCRAGIGTTLHPPGEFFKKLQGTNVDSAAIIQDFRDTMRNIKAPPVCPQLQRNININQDLASSTHIFVHHNATCKPLQSPYDRPYRVLSRANKFFTLDVNGCKDMVSQERLKPTYLETEPQNTETLPTEKSPDAAVPRNTRSGKRLHFPNRLMYAIP